MIQVRRTTYRGAQGWKVCGRDALYGLTHAEAVASRPADMTVGTMYGPVNVHWCVGLDVEAYERLGIGRER